jgi:hypothetical protein
LNLQNSYALASWRTVLADALDDIEPVASALP